MSSLGNRLKEFRISEGLSQGDFAERCGPEVSQGNVTQWESDRNKPSGSKWDAIFKAFPHLNKDWLSKGTGKMTVEAKPKQPAEDLKRIEYLEELVKTQRELIELLKKK
jgi:transcriptional regulator with XRE-family HTH domain